MNKKKRIAGFVIGSLLILTSSSISFGAVLSDNSGYSYNTGYSLSNYNTSGSVNSTGTSYSGTSNPTSAQGQTSGSTSSNTSYVNSINSYSIPQYNSYPISITSGNQTNSTSINSTPTAPVNEPQTSTSSTITENERTLANLVNEERVKAGLKPLQFDATLFKVAKIKSKDMYDNSYFSHTSPTFGSTYSLITKEGLRYTSAAENIGRTSSVTRAHQGFMNSEGHRANILKPRYTHIGIGIVGNYYTQVFISK